MRVALIFVEIFALTTIHITFSSKKESKKGFKE